MDNLRAGSVTTEGMAADKHLNTVVGFSNSTEAGEDDELMERPPPVDGEGGVAETTIVVAHLGNDNRSILTRKTSFLPLSRFTVPSPTYRPFATISWK